MKGCNPCDPHHDSALKVMEELDDGIISVFGLAEIGGFLSRNSSPEESKQFIDDLSRLPKLNVWYSSDFKNFMNTVTELSVIKGLSGADSIHAVSALSVSEVDRIVTLDSDFTKISDMIDVKLLR